MLNREEYVKLVGLVADPESVGGKEILQELYLLHQHREWLLQTLADVEWVFVDVDGQNMWECPWCHAQWSMNTPDNWREHKLNCRRKSTLSVVNYKGG